MAKILEESFQYRFSQQQWDAFVPVPLHRKKERSRGFNQSVELAHLLSKEVRIPVWKVLERLEEAPSQVEQGRDERMANLKNVFTQRTGFDVQGKSLLIIDDVLTTGTTANQCAKVLREAGAQKVAVLTIARGVMT